MYISEKLICQGLALKACFVLKIFNFYLDFIDLVVKLLDKKAKVNFKIYGIMNWETSNYNTYIPKYLKR